jgi:hypothetical protein
VIRPNKITDLAPSIPQDDKQVVVVRHSDCDYEYFLIAPGQQPLDAFVQNLPHGDTIVGQFDPASSQGKRPPSVTPLSNLTPGVPYNASGTPIRSP